MDTISYGKACSCYQMHRGKSVTPQKIPRKSVKILFVLGLEGSGFRICLTNYFKGGLYLLCMYPTWKAGSMKKTYRFMQMKRRNAFIKGLQNQ